MFFQVVARHLPSLEQGISSPLRLLEGSGLSILCFTKGPGFLVPGLRPSSSGMVRNWSLCPDLCPLMLGWVCPGLQIERQARRRGFPLTPKEVPSGGHWLQLAGSRMAAGPAPQGDGGRPGYRSLCRISRPVGQ